MANLGEPLRKPLCNNYKYMEFCTPAGRPGGSDYIVLEADKALVFRQIDGKVAYYRKLRNLTQVELARKIRVSSSVISRLERGKYNNNIPMGLLMDVAEALELDFTLLVEFDQKEKTSLLGK